MTTPMKPAEEWAEEYFNASREDTGEEAFDPHVSHVQAIQLDAARAKDEEIARLTEDVAGLSVLVSVLKTKLREAVPLLDEMIKLHRNYVVGCGMNCDCPLCTLAHELKSFALSKHLHQKGDNERPGT